MDALGDMDDQGSGSCEMRSDVVEHIEVSRPTSTYTNVDGRLLRPLEVRECTVEIVVGLKLETGPERRTGYEGRAPMPTDVCGYD